MAFYFYFSVESLEPSFDDPITNVTAIVGETVTLPCSVKDLRDYKVSLDKVSHCK